MSSRSTQVIGGPGREPAYVDQTLNALQVKVMNPGSGGGGGTQYLEDSPHTSGDTGTLALVVRKDTPGTLASADGDYAVLQVDATGALRVTGGGGGGGGTQYAEDAAHTTGDTGTLALVVRKDTPGTLTSADGDYAALQVDATGRLRVAVDASVALDITDGGGSLTVDGSVSVSNFPSVYPVNDNGGSLTVDGAVSVTGTVAVTQSGAWAVSVDDNGGSLTVDGTVAVTQSTSPWVVGQSTHANLNAQVRLQDRDGSDLLSVLVVDSATVFPMADTGIVPLAYVTDSPEPSGGGGSWAALRLNPTGLLYVINEGGNIGVNNFPSVYPVNDNGGSLTVDGTVAVSSISGTVTVSGTVTTDLGKAEDAAHASGDVGVMALAVRDDSESGLVSAAGDYAPLQVNIAGRLKVNTLVESGDATGELLRVYQGTQPSEARSRGIAPMCEVTDAPAVGTIGVWSHPFIDSNTGGLLVHILASAATNTLDSSRLEDSAHTTGNVGQFVLAVRNDTPSALAGTNGDYIPFTTDSTGRLYVNTNQSKVEDTPHVTGDTGAFMLAVRNDTASALAGTNGDYIPLTTDNAGRLYVNCNTHAVTQSGTWNIGTVTPGSAATNLGKAEDAVHASGDIGVMALAVRADTAVSLAGASGDYIPLIVDSTGRLHCNVSNALLIGDVVPGTAKGNLGKAEDAVHSDGDTGVMALVVRRDTLIASAGTTGDYSPMAVDALGALWVRNADMTTIALSGSTRGRPIQIAATATLGTTIHTATTTAGQLDRLFLWLTNTSSAAVTVTIEFGAAGTGLNVKIVVPANETVLAIDGAVIGGAATDTVTAFASTTNVINAFGRVERLG